MAACDEPVTLAHKGSKWLTSSPACTIVCHNWIYSMVRGTGSHRFHSRHNHNRHLQSGITLNVQALN